MSDIDSWINSFSRDLLELPKTIDELSQVLGKISPSSDDVLVEMQRMQRYKELLLFQNDLDEKLAKRQNHYESEYAYADSKYFIKMPGSLIQFLRFSIILHSSSIDTYIRSHANEEWSTILFVCEKGHPNEPIAYIELFDNGKQQEVYQFKTYYDKIPDDVQLWDFLIHWGQRKQKVRVDPLFLLEKADCIDEKLSCFIARKEHEKQEYMQTIRKGETLSFSLCRKGEKSMRRIDLTQIKAITEIDPDKTYILCTDLAIVEPYKDFANVLVLEFMDTTVSNHPCRFSEQHAEQIREMLLANGGDIVIACDAGISRSPAIAAALIRSFGLDDMSIWTDPRFSPNTLVFYTLCKTLGFPLRYEEVKQLKRISDNAFFKAKRIGN